MRIQPTPFRCLSCRHEWVGEAIADAPAHAVIAVLRALRCPECGIGPKRIAEIEAAVKQFHIEVDGTIDRLREICGDFTIPAQMIEAPNLPEDGFLTEADFEGLL